MQTLFINTSEKSAFIYVYISTGGQGAASEEIPGARQLRHSNISIYNEYSYVFCIVASSGYRWLTRGMTLKDTVC